MREDFGYPQDKKTEEINSGDLYKNLLLYKDLKKIRSIKTGGWLSNIENIHEYHLNK